METSAHEVIDVWTEWQLRMTPRSRTVLAGWMVAPQINVS